jgi:plastocyanin
MPRSRVSRRHPHSPVHNSRLKRVAGGVEIHEMTHLPAPHGPPGALQRARRRALRVVLATAVAFGIGLGEASPGVAGTVLRGRVTLPATMPAGTREAPGSRPAVNPADVGVYITEKPGVGKPRLPGRGTRADVELNGDQFTPQVLAVTVGSKLRFRNRDRVFHSPFGVSSAGRVEFGSLAPGARIEVRFDHPGINNLFCQLHPGSAGFVIVCPNWFHTRPSATGDYALPPLPRGSYIVHAWHPRLREIRRSVEVTGRDIVRFDLSF